MEQELFELVHGIGEIIDKGICIERQDVENPEDIHYRVYRSKGYCFDIIASDQEYLFFCEHEGFKKIKPSRAIELINQTFQLIV